jgi:cytochrome c oxidase cbb3-type subunit 3
MLVGISSCNRERRQLRDEPPRRGIFSAAVESPLSPGGPVQRVEVRSPYEGNAYAISEGNRLYHWYNCGGCHSANGGGAIGPPLTGPKFVYGKDPANIFDTIMKGRPNGMPSWGGRLQEYQIWQIVAYVRSLSGGEPKSATSGRDDSLEHKTAAQLK